MFVTYHGLVRVKDIPFDPLLLCFSNAGTQLYIQSIASNNLYSALIILQSEISEPFSTY